MLNVIPVCDGLYKNTPPALLSTILPFALPPNGLRYLRGAGGGTPSDWENAEA